jgi:DNA primase
MIRTIAELIHVSDNEAWNIARQYGRTYAQVKKVKIDKKEFTFPSNTSALQENHKKYLRKRGFIPEELQKDWFIKGTGPLSKIDKIDYRFRIVIPYIWNGVPVSFDARDITDKQRNKYQACPKEYEEIEHKRILYGDQEKWNPELGICVEGPTDVWRIGKQAFAVSGIAYTPAQVRLIATIFKRVAVVFDDDPQAQVQAKKLIAELKFRGVDAFNVKIKGDPGSMRQKEVKELLEKIKTL